MDGDFFEALAGVAEAFGLGEVVKGALRPAGYTSGPSVRTGDDEAVPYSYERILTRPRDPRINDR